MNEIRNELLLIYQLVKSENEEDKKRNLEWLLERYQYDIERQLEDIKYKERELKDNLATLEHVRKELGIKEK